MGAFSSRQRTRGREPAEAAGRLKLSWGWQDKLDASAPRASWRGAEGYEPTCRGHLNRGLWADASPAESVL